MTDVCLSIIFLSGAGGGAPDLNIFRADAQDATRVEVVKYPGWRSYIKDSFSADALIEELVGVIMARVSRGPIGIVGLSIGAHFGYAVALRLQAIGREIVGFCAIDSFMAISSEPSAGWKARALAEGWRLISSFRFVELGQFLRSRFWRTLNRLAGDRLPSVLRSSERWLPSTLSFDPVLEEEINMRLLIRRTAAWVASLDRDVVPLKVPAILLRTHGAAEEDAAWRRRCPSIQVYEIPGRHHTLFEPGNVEVMHTIFVEATRGWRK